MPRLPGWGGPTSLTTTHYRQCYGEIDARTGRRVGGRQPKLSDRPPTLPAVGMYGNWLRVTPDQLERARNDLDWAHEYAETAVECNDERWFSTDKTWHALAFLLDRYGLGVPIVYGAEWFVDLPDGGPEDDAYLDGGDWGYMPPSYLTPEQVSEAAAELASLTEADLLRGVDPAELTREEIYPSVWDRSYEELTWVTSYLPDIRRYFTAAAKNGDAVICWID